MKNKTYSYKKLLVLVGIIVVWVLVIQIDRSSKSSVYITNTNRVVVQTDEAVSGIKKLDEESDSYILFIYDKANKSSVQAKENMTSSLDYMKVNYKVVDVSKLTQEIYSDYSTIIVITPELEKGVGEEIDVLLNYAKAGGNLFFGIVPEEASGFWRAISRPLGIVEMGGYLSIDGIKFMDEVIPAISGRTLQDEKTFDDMCIKYVLDDSCKVYMESYGKVMGNPLMWGREMEKGKVAVYNGGALGYEGSAGIFAGIIALLEEDFMYPIINARVIFIDDFPSPQYNNSSGITVGDYNRDVKTFYRDIWWPDMQKIAKQYQFIYTGLYIASYNDIVDPEGFIFESDNMMQYYGNSLLKNGGELGLHGYNHQSLVGEGYLPPEEGYKPWQSQEDMASSIRALVSVMEQEFPNSTFKTYVPPSNFLSEEGRRAIKEAVPDLKMVSGIYLASEEESYSYIQRFEVAEDGMVEFPRITAGMWYEDETIFQYMNGLALHGVFSHFIHPDDILDEERGRGASWEKLVDGLSRIFKDINEYFSAIRPLKAEEAAKAVEVYDALEVRLSYEADQIQGECDVFYGEAFFYLRTEKLPLAVDESCEITHIGDGVFYLVKVKEPNFIIKLVE